MNAWRELLRLPRRLWVLAAANLINRAGTMALPLLSLYLIKEKGFTAAQAGSLLALYGAVGLLIGPIAGALCDRWGTNRVMVWSMAAAGLCQLAFVFARGVPAIAAMTILWAASGEAFRPAGMTVVSESAPPDMRKQANALNRLAINLGMSVGPAAGGFLAAVSFRALWAVDGATTLAAAAVLALFLSDAGPQRAGAESTGWPSLRGLADARLRRALLGGLLVGLVFFQHEGALPVFLVRDLHLTASFYGLLFTLNTAMIVLLEIPLNHATSSWSHRRALSVGAALFAAGYGAHAFAARGRDVMAATAVWTFGEMIFIPALTSHIADISPESRRGEYMGLYSMAFASAFMLGPWAGLVALDRAGPTALWTAVFLAGAAAAVLFASLPPERAR